MKCVAVCRIDDLRGTDCQEEALPRDIFCWVHRKAANSEAPICMGRDDIDACQRPATHNGFCDKHKHKHKEKT